MRRQHDLDKERDKLDYCDCKCHEVHDADLVPFCTRCDHDYASWCSG